MSQQYSILIVDDEDRLRLSLSLILQKEHYRVATAANAAEALERLQSQEYDLMFLDLSLPGMRGIDLLIEIHRQFTRMAVLILTAHAALDSAMHDDSVHVVIIGARRTAFLVRARHQGQRRARSPR